MILLIFLIVLLLLFGVGYYGRGAGWGTYGWSPLGLLILVVLILALTGNLSFR